MKKGIAVLFLFVLLAACQSLDSKLTEKAQVQERPQSEKGVTVMAEKEVYDAETDTIIVLIQNDSNDDYMTGAHLFLEKKVDGVWYEFPYDRDEFTEEGIVHMAGTTSSLGLSVAELKYKLTPGEYRGNINNLSAPFDVK